MRAVRITTLDGPSAVEYTEIDEPDGTGQVLIDVHAAGVTFPEVLQSRGRYQIKPELPFVPGSEVAGVVRSAPDGAHVRAGDRVAAFPALGGFAEVVATPAQFVFPLPGAISFVAGAALPMNYLTMQFGLFRRGNLQAGETVLVHGAAGGVGTAAIQLASAAGARVIAVTSTPEKGETAKAAGADEVVTADGFKDQVTELTGGRGVDMVVDPVGGDRFTDSLRTLDVGGRLAVVGFAGGAIPTVKVNRLLLRDLSVVGVALEPWSRRHPEIMTTLAEELEAALRAGTIRPVVGDVLALEQGAQALRLIDGRAALGKVVVAVRPAG